MITDSPHLDAVPVITPELMRGACGFWGVTQVLLLIRPISTVIVLITNKVPRDTPPVLTRKLICIAGRVRAAPLITVVSTVIAPITPECLPDASSVCTAELPCRASSHGAILQLVQGVRAVRIAITDPVLWDAPPVGRSAVDTGKLSAGTVLKLTVMPLVLVTHVPTVVIAITDPIA